MRDLKNTLEVLKTISPAAANASVTGTGIDLASYGSTLIVFDVGAITDGTHAPKIQESDDNAIFTDVAAADLIGSLSNLATGVIQEIGYIGKKRYIRPFVTVTGATTGGVYGAVAIGGDARKQPL